MTDKKISKSKATRVIISSAEAVLHIPNDELLHFTADLFIRTLTMSHKNGTVRLKWQKTAGWRHWCSLYSYQQALQIEYSSLPYQGKKKKKQSPSATITPKDRGISCASFSLHECESIKAFYTAERGDTCNILFIGVPVSAAGNTTPLIQDTTERVPTLKWQ